MNNEGVLLAALGTKISRLKVGKTISVRLDYGVENVPNGTYRVADNRKRPTRVYDILVDESIVGSCYGRPITVTRLKDIKNKE